MKSKKKIYFIATTVPGDFGGSELRNYNLIKQSVEQVGADVEVFCISPKDQEIARKDFESGVSARCHIVPSYPRSLVTAMRAVFLKHTPPFMDDFESSGLGNLFRKACEVSLPDIVQIEQPHAYYCIRPHIPWLKKQGVKIIFDCHNVEFQSFKDSLELFSLPKKLIGIFLVPYLKRLEIEATQQSDLIFACSQSDADFFKQYNPRTYVIPNGVDCSEFQSYATNKNSYPSIVFMGIGGYPPNADAMQFYLNAIHPKIKKEAPNIILLAIGTNQEWLRSIGIDDLSVKPLGFVEDIRPYLDQALIGICPIRYGSGTRIKIMTYMAAGLPVVSTKKGAEGVAYTNGHNIIITDDPDEFAESILKLLRDKSYRDEIARNGHSFISQNYDWNAIGRSVARIYQDDLG